MSTKSDDQETIRQKHARLILELPKKGGFWQQHIFLYQGSWLFSRVLLGAMLMQKTFKPRSNDILLSAFMKSGTTWLRTLMFSTLHRSRFDFSSHPLLHQGPHECFPQFDILEDFSFADSDDHFPRLFASHFAYSLFPSSVTDPTSRCKFVYVCRDPKDVLVSKFHFLSKLRPKELPPLSFNQAFEMFCEGVSEYGPYWDHVLGFWRASLESPEKILFLKYEELKKDPKAQVNRLAEFMGVPVSVEEEENGVVEKIVNFCSFDHLKNLEVNKTGIQRFGDVLELENRLLFRRGVVGDWKNHLTEEMGERIDRITRDKFKDSGLTIGGATRK